MSERIDPLVLSNDCAAAVVAVLDVPSALSLSACSKSWRQLVLQDERLWQAWAARDLPPSLLRAAAAAAATGQSSWRAAYEHATRLQSLRRVAWSGEDGQHSPSIAGRHPRPREGHAACSWGTRSMLVCGGFGGGILSGGDLHLLTPAKRSGGGGGSGSTSGGSGSGASPGGNTSGGLRWVQPSVHGRPPVHRYGHTLTRCGRDGELAVLFGGLQAGGYQAPLDTLAVLRRKAAPLGCRPANGAVGATGGTAAAAGSSGSDGGDSEGGSGGSGQEEDTSLALRLGGWQGGADGGGMQQLLWAQMFDFFMDHDEEEEEEEEDEEEDGFGGLTDGDSQGAGGSSSSGAIDDGPGSDTGSEYGSAVEDGSSDEEWLPSQASPRPASVVAAMARRSSSPDLPAAAAAGTGAASTAAEGARAAAGSGQQRPAAAASPAAGSPAAAGAAAAAAGEVAWGGEDAALAEEELEWFYPRVSGEPPGVRGYHSAAASEDGTKLYVFGGICSSGSCDTLAVLDLTTWTWSRPHTHGTPPSSRCGHSSVVYGGRLWVVGGGSGRDLLRSGRDLGDVHCLDLATMEWRRLALPPGPLCAGKCHASALVGRRLLLFGGSMASCNELAWLDLEREEWGAPARVAGPPPCERMSGTAVLCGDEMVVYGGYTFNYREVGDVHRLCLLSEAGSAAAEADGRGERAARRRQRWGPWW